MAPNIGRYANKTILVSLRTSSGSGPCVPYKLIGVELVGLWLEGDELVSSYIGPQYGNAGAVGWLFFVPFAQIACVAIPGMSSPGAVNSSGSETPPPGEPTAKRKRTKSESE